MQGQQACRLCRSDERLSALSYVKQPVQLQSYDLSPIRGFVRSAAQQPHQRNEVREGKNKRAVGFRRVVREKSDEAAQSAVTL